MEFAMFQIPDVSPFLVTLQYLSLQGNLLSTVDLDYFSPFLALTKIDVSFNFIMNYTLTDTVMIETFLINQNDVSLLNFNDFSHTPRVHLQDTLPKF